MNSWLLLRRLRGPAFLMLVGVTALLNQWGILGFGRSWPLYLILAGIFGLAERAMLTGRPAVPPAYPNAYPAPAYPQGAYTPVVTTPIPQPNTTANSNPSSANPASNPSSSDPLQDPFADPFADPERRS